jgi:hypothetical protein
MVERGGAKRRSEEAIRPPAPTLLSEFSRACDRNDDAITA